LKKAKASVITCEPLKKVSDKESFIKNEFKEAGRKVSSAAISALIDATGSDMRELAASCRQIAFDVAASKEVIDEGDIANFYQGRVEASGFDVADAVIAGDETGALIALRNALDTGTDPVMIIAATASSVRTIAKVAGEPRNANPYQLASKLGLAPWQIEKARKSISRWSPQLIKFSIQELAAADVAVKGGESDPIYAVERCVLAIAGKVAGKASV
jgi:DNA polymerase-3 subunit delta